MRAVAACAMALVLGACASTPEGNVAQTPTDRFVRRSPEQNPDAAKKVAEAKLLLRNGGTDRYRIYRMVLPYIETSEEAAELVIENKLTASYGPSTDQGRAYRYDTSRAMEALISFGRGEYLRQYWEQIGSSGDVISRFDPRWAASAMAWYAEQEPSSATGRFSQWELVNYWINGCHRSQFERDRGYKESVFGLISDSPYCKPDPRLAGRYFAMYAGAGDDAGSDGRNAEAIRLASSVAHAYLGRKDYGRAAGWFSVVLSLDSQVKTKISPAEAEQLFVAMYRPNEIVTVNGKVVTIGDRIYQATDFAAARYRERIDDAITSLQLIQQMGVTAIAAF